MEQQNEKRGLNRDFIKYCAMLTMFLNHLANILLPAGTVIHEILIDIGYFTAVTMCYFLVEGYHYTRSKRKYGERLLLFAVISQIPYLLALQFYQLNMLFTLFICFLILYVMERVKQLPLKVLYILLLVFVSLFSDWALLAPVFTILFAWSKNNKSKMVVTYAASALLFGAFNFMSYSMMDPDSNALMHSFFSILGILLSGIIILVFYNGKRSERSGKFTKWFFYIFYPAHLLLLWLIKIMFF